MAKTEIFDSYEEFVTQTRNSPVNGVSKEFAEKYDIDLDKDDGNVKCWNCLDCEKCVSCINCVKCFKCEVCVNCVDCSRCSDCFICVDCFDSSYLSDCESCSSCSFCSNCENCLRADVCVSVIHVKDGKNLRGEPRTNFHLKDKLVRNSDCLHVTKLNEPEKTTIGS